MKGVESSESKGKRRPAPAAEAVQVQRTESRLLRSYGAVTPLHQPEDWTDVRRQFEEAASTSPSSVACLPSRKRPGRPAVVGEPSAVPRWDRPGNPESLLVDAVEQIGVPASACA